MHGDYDVDGIAATTLAVLLLRELGADVDWHLPSRFDEGYGVRSSTLARLADEGCGLVLTVDCGITAVEEVAEAKARGLEVIVTDHHRPGASLPDCPIVATRPSDYPFPELCGTGVVYKLGQALFGVDSDVPKRHLDLVALATIADVVPLLDENRSMVIAGLRALARTQKIGLQALMRVAGVDPAAIDAGAVGFRLGPRINAAGRLGHPKAALELLLTDDPDDAHRLANSLEELNKERQAVEGRIVREAIAQVESWPEEHRQRRAYVVAGEDWHEGVIGIVASRLVEKFNRPVVLIAGGEGDWKGSGRSIPSFDLHGGLGACSELLERWGGHRAAAGLSIAPGNIAAFAARFAEHAAGLLLDEDLAPVTHVDAVVPRGRLLTLDLCTELAQLAPFGLGNPAVTLLAAGCELDALSTVGDGKHLRFRVRRDGTDAGSAIAFGIGSRLDSYRREGRWDVAFRLEENRWNGTVSPQLVVRRIFGADAGYEELRAWLVSEYRKAPRSAQRRRGRGLRGARGRGGRPRPPPPARVRALPSAARARACARPRGLVRLAGDEDRPAEQLALEAQVVVPRLLVPLADVGGVRVARICRQPLLERTPVLRLVVVPILLARRDQALEREARGLEAGDCLAQRHPALVVDAARQRPLLPVRLADDDVAAGPHRGRKRLDRPAEVVPDEGRTEAERSVPGPRLERNGVRVRFDDLDEIPEPCRFDAPVRRLDELGCALDAVDAAAERRGEEQCRAALAAGQVEHAGLRAEVEVVPEQHDLLRARRVLDLVVALGDCVVPRHGRKPMSCGLDFVRPRCRATVARRACARGGRGVPGRRAPRTHARASRSSGPLCGGFCA